MEEAPENGKDSSQSSHANGMNEWMNESDQGSESLSGLISYRCHSTFSTSHGLQLVGDFKR